MTKLAIVTLALLALSGNAFAANMTRAECSEAYKAHKAAPSYAKPAKGEGNAAWNTFRRETCGTKANPRKADLDNGSAFQVAAKRGKSRKA